MTRSVHTFVLCLVGLGLGACYDHRTVEEKDVSSITGDEDAGTDESSDNGGANAGGNEGDNSGGEAGQGPFGELDCENPPDRVTELLCGLQEGGMTGGMATGGGFPGASTGGRPGSTTGGRPGSTTGGTTGGMSGATTGRPGGTTGGFPGMTAGTQDPEEIIEEILENLDCKQKDPDVITQLLCALLGGSGGAPGGGGPFGGGGPGGGPFGGNR